MITRLTSVVVILIVGYSAAMPCRAAEAGRAEDPASPPPPAATTAPPVAVSSGSFSGAVQAGGPGAPTISSEYLQAASSFDQAAASTTGERHDCYQNWASYYRALAAQLQSGSSQTPVKPACDPFASNGGAAGAAPATAQQGAATAGPAIPDGMSPIVWKSLRPQDQLLVSTLGSLKNLVDTQVKDEVAPAQSWEDERNAKQSEYLEIWSRVARRLKPMLSDPHLEDCRLWQFMHEDRDCVHYDIENIVKQFSSTKSGVVDDFTIHRDIETTPTYLAAFHADELTYKHWQAWQLQEARQEVLVRVGAVAVPPSPADIDAGKGDWIGKTADEMKQGVLIQLSVVGGRAEIRLHITNADQHISWDGTSRFGLWDNGEIVGYFFDEKTPNYKSYVHLKLSEGQLSGSLTGIKFDPKTGLALIDSPTKFGELRKKQS